MGSGTKWECHGVSSGGCASWSSSLLRSRVLHIGCFLLGLGLSFLVGLVLHRSDLSARREAFGLKCDNRKEILRAVVENNLNASFVSIGLIASVPLLNESVWVSFTKNTYFLRSDVTRISWLERVLDSDRAAFEKRMNATILGLDYNLKFVPRSKDTEYAPIVYASEDVSGYLMADPTSLPTVKPGVENARDTGVVSAASPDLYGGVWRMGCYLAYYGTNNPASLTTVDMRRQACLGYIGVSLAVEVVFAGVLSRFIDDVEMDVAAAYVPSQPYEFLPSYNCTPGAACELFIYDPAGRAHEKSTAAVQWNYGFQNFELRCYAKQSLWLSALYSIIAWPLLMSLLVLLLYVLVYLILKRLESFEKEKLCMEKFNADLRAAKVAAEAADKAKSSFLATVSHEIRTPMNGVIGMTNLLMGTELNSQQLEYVKIAKASGNSLVSLINDVLDLSKIEAGKMEIESVPFDLHAVIEDVISVFEEKIQQNQLEVSALVHDSVPPCLIGDPGKLKQVLVNIVGNAMKFTKKGSIFVCVRIVDSEDKSLSFPTTETVATSFSGSDDPDAMLTKVVPIQVKKKRRFSWSYLRRSPNDQLSVLEAAVKPIEGPQIKQWQQWKDGVLGGDNCASHALSMQFGTKESVERWRSWQPDEVMDQKDPPNVTVAISVEDTGIGIPPDLQYRLFQPFLQADSSTSRQYGGTGIGLSICKKLVELMEGHLTVSSQPGEGSVFEMIVPLVKGGTIERVISNTHDRSSEHMAENHDSAEPKLRGLRVMIVDSHHIRREVTASYLQRLGMVVQDAEGSLSALDLVKRKDIPSFQAVIVDLQGIEHAAALQLAQAVCKEADRKTVPMVALSFALSSAAQQELREAGFSLTVQKPLRQTTLAVGLLQAVGAQLQTTSKKVNCKMLAGKHLLVVDDNLVNRRVASLMLSQYGASVCSVASGPEAISTLKKQEKKVELVLMDIQMPGMDGYETTRHIRQWELESCTECPIPDASNILSWRDGSGCQHHRLPIVAVTADVMKGTHDLCFEAGMDDYISKPLDQRQLRLLLERFLK